MDDPPRGPSPIAGAVETLRIIQAQNEVLRKALAPPLAVVRDAAVREAGGDPDETEWVPLFLDPLQDPAGDRFVAGLDKVRRLCLEVLRIPPDLLDEDPPAEK